MGKLIKRLKTKVKKIKKFDLQQVPLANFVVFSLAMIIIYTIVIIILALVGIENSVLDTLTTCYYSVWGGEIVTCGLIKIFKLKDTKKETDTDVNNDTPVG